MNDPAAEAIAALCAVLHEYDLDPATEVARYSAPVSYEALNFIEWADQRVASTTTVEVEELRRWAVDVTHHPDTDRADIEARAKAMIAAKGATATPNAIPARLVHNDMEANPTRGAE